MRFVAVGHGAPKGGDVLLHAVGRARCRFPIHDLLFPHGAWKFAAALILLRRWRHVTHRPMPCIDSQTRTGVNGGLMWRMPSGDKASHTAFQTALMDPVVPDSPRPLAPSGLLGDGVTVWAVRNAGRSAATGI